MDFVEIDILCTEDLKDILTAELYQLGYDSFLETSEGLKAYRPVDAHNPNTVGELLERYTLDTNFRSRRVIDQNWNEIWEKNFEPVQITRDCRIRASFHTPDSSIPFEIIINPRMSFGTGHHETTSQAARFMLDLKHQGLSVLDVGCGTGVLSILAEKKGAAKIVGIDNDLNAVINAKDNIQLNNCNRVGILHASIAELPNALLFDLIVANINRNVLLEEIGQYSNHLNKSGCLILSGFYTDDSSVVVKKCEAEALKVNRQTEENQWACLLLEKK